MLLPYENKKNSNNQKNLGIFFRENKLNIAVLPTGLMYSFSDV